MRVRGDVEAPPWRREALEGAWANASYAHVPRTRLPLALARMHDTLQVDAPLSLTLRATADGAVGPTDAVARWTPDDVARLLEGAGFALRSLREHTADGPRIDVTAARLRTLPDIVGPGMRLVVCGLNPSVYSADRGIAFARPGNRFWPAALAAGLVSRPRDPWHALREHGIGFTDLVKRATARADALTADDYRAGVARVTWLAELLRPAVICVVGLTGWRAAVDPRADAGPQRQDLGGVPVYLMPNTSGLNAHATPADFAIHLRRALLTGSPG